MLFVKLFVFLIGATVALHFGLTEGLVGSIKVSLATLIVSLIATVWHHLQQFDANHEDVRSRFYHGMVFVTHAMVYFVSCVVHAYLITQFTGGIGWEELLQAGQPELGRVLLWGGIAIVTGTLLYFTYDNRWRFQKSAAEKNYEWHAKDRRDHLK